MFDDRRPRRQLARSSLSGVILVALVVAACGGASASVAPSSTATPVATPTAVPTPSPSPVDVSAAFVKRIVDPTFSATAKITGNLSVGSVKGDISGSAVFSGADSSQSMSITATGFKQETESVHAGTTSWSREAPGPWLEDPAKPAGTQNSSLNEILKALVSVEDLGLESHGGEPLHHLRSTRGNEIPASVFGVNPSTAKDARFTLDFYATDDGTPAIMAIAGSWTQVGSGAQVPTTMAFDIAFGNLGKPQTIKPPDDVWVRYASKALGYAMAHPADWTVKAAKGEDSYVVNGQGYVYVGVTPYTGSTAKFVTELKASYKKPFKGDPKSEAPSRLGGVAAVSLIYDFTSDNNQALTVADDVVSRNGKGWEVYMVTTSGGSEDIDVFNQFVATFQFTD